ncbi:MAG TPA: alpha/beta hydrolase [Nocardioidaceae bacterium]
MLHPQARAAIALWSQEPSVVGAGPEQIAERRRLAREAAAAEPKEPVGAVDDVDADGVRCRLYLPGAADGGRAGREPVVVFLHGGGFVFGELETHDAQARRLANRTGMAVLSVDYRRPPEHPFPAAPDDVDTVVSWLRDAGPALGLDTGRAAVLGDSAGGNLALVAALRNPGTFTAAVLVYPFIDPSGRHYTAERDNGGLSAEECRWYWSQYAAGAGDLADPDLAPIESPRLGTLPPTLVQVAEEDILHGEDLELVRRIEAAGGTVTRSTYPGMVHGFWRRPELFDAAEDALADAAGFLARTVSRAEGGPRTTPPPGRT